MDRRQIIHAAAGALALGAVGRSAAQAYPSGPITVVLPLQAGSASDVAVRQMAERLGPKLGAPLVVENVVGAAGLIGLERLSKVKADGQTIAALNNSIVSILPHLQPARMKLDTRKDFVPIAGIANIPTFLGVKRGSPFKNVKDLVAFAKQNPDKLMYSSGGIGSPQHLASEMLSAYTGAKLLHVPYKGASQAALGLAAGEVDVMTIALSLALPFLADGRVELIGYCGPKRHAQFGDLPTLQEQGVKDYDYSSWIGLFAPAAIPAAALSTLRSHAAAAAAERTLHTQLIRAGMEPWERSPDQLQRVLEDDYSRWARIVKTANVQAS
jgi:tripartite-type tricarboxylate transporter receptor subunit TctC